MLALAACVPSARFASAQEPAAPGAGHALSAPVLEGALAPQPAIAPTLAASASLGDALADPMAPPSPTPSVASGSDPWTFDLTATTSLPLSVGVEANLQSPVGLSGYLSLGHTPAAYLDMIATILADQDVYNVDRLGPIIEDSISDGAWNLRLGLGYAHPEGFEIAIGYTVIAGETTIGTDAIDRAARQRLPWSGMREVPITLTLHAISGRIGWRFVIEEHLVIRAALGWTHAVDSEVSIHVPDEVRRMRDDPATEMETSMRDALSVYGFSPELVLSAGYRF